MVSKIFATKKNTFGTLKENNIGNIEHYNRLLTKQSPDIFQNKTELVAVEVPEQLSQSYKESQIYIISMVKVCQLSSEPRTDFNSIEIVSLIRCCQ